MPRLALFSKYWVFFRPGAWASAKVYAMLTPSIGSCLNPFTSSGCLIPIGQETTIGLRVPPKCAATSLVDRKGVLPAHAQPAWYMLSTLGEPRAGSPPTFA